MTSTHTGNPICCAATLASIDIILKEDLAGNAARMGEILHSELKDIAEAAFRRSAASMAKVWWRVSPASSPATKEPDGALAARIVERCIEKGVLMFSPVGFGGGTVKICPPLVINEEATAGKPRRLPRSGTRRRSLERPQVLIVGGGMITHDQILPSLLHLQQLGVVCGSRCRRTARRDDSRKLQGAFPGRDFSTFIPSDGAPQPDLYKEQIARHAAAETSSMVALPDQLHYEAVMTALEHGQHVLCVKPLVLTAKRVGSRLRRLRASVIWLSASNTTNASMIAV